MGVVFREGGVHDGIPDSGLGFVRAVEAYFVRNGGAHALAVETGAFGWWR